VEDFSVTGEAKEYTSPSNRGAPTTRHFCGVCGSTVYGSGEREDVTVYAGTLDDPAAFVPRDQVFVRSRQAWAHIAPGALPEHDKLPEGA
jgi:hypothetical protein